MQSTHQLLEMLQGPEQAIRLDLGALLIARHADRDLDIHQSLGRLDALASKVSEPTLDGVSRLLFRDLGFSGDQANYYDPRNSFLDKAMLRRQGLPITLSVLMIEVGRRVGVPLDGVGMPGHFLVRDRVLEDTFVDPFAAGAVLGRSECERLFRRLAGPKTPFLDSYLAPTSKRDILGRISANLVNAYRRSGDLAAIGWSCSLRSQMPHISPAEKIQLAQSLDMAGRSNEAAALIEQATANLPSDDSEEWHQEANRMRARSN